METIFSKKSILKSFVLTIVILIGCVGMSLGQSFQIVKAFYNNKGWNSGDGFGDIYEGASFISCKEGVSWYIKGTGQNQTIEFQVLVVEENKALGEDGCSYTSTGSGFSEFYKAQLGWENNSVKHAANCGKVYTNSGQDFYIVLTKQGTNIVVSYTTTKPVCEASVTGDVSISADKLTFCDEPYPVLTLTKNYDVVAVDDDYPIEKWYKGENPISENKTTTLTVTEAATYTYRVYASATKYLISNAITISAPNGTPYIVSDKESVNFSSTTGNTPSDVTITPRMENTCGSETITTTLTEGSDYFTLTANADGTYTVTPTYSTSTKGTYSGKIQLTATGRTTVEIPITGAVYDPLTAVSIANCTQIGASTSEYTATVTGGAEPLSYQWYVNGSAVNGATSSTYTPSSTPTSIYCKVTDAGGVTLTSSDIGEISVKAFYNVTLDGGIQQCLTKRYFKGKVSAYQLASFAILRGSTYLTGITGTDISENSWYVNEVGGYRSVYQLTKTFGSDTDVWFFIDGQQISYQTTPPECTSTISTATLDANPKAFCNSSDVIRLTVSDDGTNPASCYPQYRWYYNGNVLQTSGSNTLDVTIDQAGYYYCEVYVDANTKATTEAVSLATPAPSIVLAEQTLSFESQKGETIASKTTTPEIKGSCSDEITAEVTGPFTVIDNNDGSFTVTPTYSIKEITDAPYTGTLTFKTLAADGVSYITETENLYGYVYQCSGEVVATYDFNDGKLPKSEDGFSTSLTIKTSDYDDYSYCAAISNTKKYTGNVNNVYLNNLSLSSNAFVTSGIGNSSNPYNAFALTIPSVEKTYMISFVCVNYGPNSSDIVIGSNEYTLAAGETKTIAVPVSGITSQIVSVRSSVTYYPTGIAFDDITITKLCPPTVSVELTGGAPCTGSGEFTATVSGTGPFTYVWKVNGSIQETITEDDSNVGTLNTWVCSSNLSSGDKVTCVVTDANNLSDESNEYEVSCLAVYPKIYDGTTEVSSACLGSTVKVKISDAEKTTLAASNYTYQWFLGSQSVSSATTMYNDLTLTGILASQAGTYTLHVTENGTTSVSAAAKLTVSIPAFTVSTESVSLSSSNSYSQSITTTASNTCYSSATTNIQGTDAAQFAVAQSGNTYTVTLSSDAQKVAGKYSATMQMYDRDASNMKTIALSAEVGLTLASPTSDRPCVAAIGFTAKIPATKAGATYEWFVNSAAQVTGTIAASTSETTVTFNPSADLGINDIVILKVTTTDGVSAQSQMTIASCGPKVVFSGSLTDGETYKACPSNSVTLSFTATPTNATGYTATYQWYKDDVKLDGKTSTSLNVTNGEGQHTYRLQSTLTNNTNSSDIYIDNVSVIVDGVSSTALTFSDVEGCPSTAVNFVETNNETGVYWSSSEVSSLTGPSTSNLIQTGKTFGTNGTVVTYNFSYKDDFNTYCRNTSAKATSKETMKITSENVDALSYLCQNATSKSGIATMKVKVTNCSGAELDADDGVTYQWYRTTTKNSTTIGTEITGATTAELDKDLIDATTTGTYYYYCKITKDGNVSYSDFWSLTVDPSPAKPVIADESVENATYYVVPLSDLYLSESADKWDYSKSYAKGDQYKITYGSGTTHTFYARYLIETDNRKCPSEIEEFKVWSGYGVGYISESTNFGDATLCRNDATSQPTWYVQGASQWGMNNISYQWHKVTTDKDNKEVDEIVSTSNTYTPAIDVAGTFKYYCIISCLGHSETKQLGPYTLTVNGMNGLGIEDVYVCAGNGSEVKIPYANTKYDVKYEIASTGYETSKVRSAGSSDDLLVGVCGSGIAANTDFDRKFWVKVVDENGCETKDYVSVHFVYNKISISKESIDDADVCAGNVKPLVVNTVFSCSGGAPKYQWYKSSSIEIDPTKDTQITGATSNSYTPTEDGYYYCVVTNDVYSTATSSVAQVTIHPTPEPNVVTTPALSNGVEISGVSTDNVLDFYCTGSASFTAANGFAAYTWSAGSVTDGVFTPTTNVSASVVNGFTYTPDCDDLNQPTAFRVQVTDLNGCTAEQIITMNIHPVGNTYYYCGPTGDASDLNNVDNWCTVENATIATCMHPTDFIRDATKYIINKDDVVLKSDQTWTVGGKGTKIEVSDGYWSKLSQGVGGATASLNWEDVDGVKYGRIVEFYSSIGSNKVEDNFAAIASYDFRDDAKSLKISGVLNCNDGVTIDVNGGGALEITTDQGNPAIGTCATDTYKNYEPDKSTSYNVWVIPGSSVTYSGSGVNKIQAATYSQLYIETDDATADFPSDYVEIEQSMVVTGSKGVETTGDVWYTGSLNQTIAPITYNTLKLDNASKKEMGGDITVKDQLYIGPSATLVGGDDYNVMTIAASGTSAVEYKGKFDAGNCLFEYVSESETTIAPMPYYSLALSDVDVTKNKKDGKIESVTVTEKSVNGSRTLSEENVIGVAGNMYVKSGTSYVSTNSKVEFNGTSKQEIPEFKFYNLSINNTAVANNTSSAMDNINSVVIAGNVTVTNQLQMNNGILYTDNYQVKDGEKVGEVQNYKPAYTLSVTNTDANAVTMGHYTSTQDASFIVGSLQRSLPSGTTSNTSDYNFPMGNFTKYYQPLSLSSITTTGEATVTVSAEDGVAGSDMLSPLEAIDHTKYWNIQGSANYTSASVSIESLDNLGEYNSIAYSVKKEGTFETIYGTVSGKGINNSNTTTETSIAVGSGVVTFGKRISNPHTYYYDCSTDITDIDSWWTGEKGTGTQATAFNEDDATWIINCDAVVSTKPLTITGSNVVVRLGNKAQLSVNNTTSFSSLVQEENSSIQIASKKEFTVYGSHELGHYASVKNYGVFNTYSKSLAVDYGAGVYNYQGATWNISNSSLQVSSSDGSTNQKSGHIINEGTINMTNSDLYVEGRFTEVKNTSGAVWNIDNSMSGNTKSVVFDNVEFRNTNNLNQYVDLECGSAFYVKNSDVTIWYGGMEDNTAYIDGDLIVEDGNMLVRRKAQGGGNMNISGGGCGSIYLMDTDDSGDGILTIQGSGGSNFDIYGTVYAMGIVTQGGSGDKINVKDGGFLFIGDMGATLSQYSWVFTINVEKGGTLNYCGNRTAVGDNVGTNAGTLNYAESFYKNGLDNPVKQGDFTDDKGYISALYADNEACMADYNNRTKQEIDALLPIELTMLYGICIDDNVVQLRWQTASETNNDYFTILRSFDGINFEEIDFVWGAGTTNAMHNYEVLDKDEKEGIVYYKLRQTDYDGNSTDSKVIAVQTCGKNAQFNIAQDEITISFRNAESKNFVVITSVTGQIFYSKTFSNVEEARIATPQRKGIYIISVIDATTITSEKFVK